MRAHLYVSYIVVVVCAVFRLLAFALSLNRFSARGCTSHYDYYDTLQTTSTILVVVDGAMNRG